MLTLVATEGHDDIDKTEEEVKYEYQTNFNIKSLSGKYNKSFIK